MPDVTLPTDFDELYDWSAFEPRPPREVRTTRRGAVPLAAALWAVGDVVLAERRVDPVVEEVPMPTPDPNQRVVVHLVWGEPRLSYVRVLGISAVHMRQ